MNPTNELRTANGRIIRRLLIAVVAMFGFGYALVPLYDVFCQVTGFSGRTGVVQAENLGSSDETRLVTVQFIGSTNSDLDWDFKPNVKSMQVHPGGLYEATYNAKNRSMQATVGSARPSVTPLEASRYFNKTECFCFTKQAFAAGEARDMPVRFVVDADLPKEIQTVTLSYTFFDATQSASEPST